MYELEMPQNDFTSISQKTIFSYLFSYLKYSTIYSK